MAIVVRPPELADREAWERLWAQYNAFYGRQGPTALPESIVENSWRRLLDPDEPVFGLVAEREGSLLGLAHVVFHRNLLQLADTCYLQDLFTTQEARGAGVGRGLVDAVVELCKARGVKDVYWHTHVSNAVARGLYDRIAVDTGFVVYRNRFG